MKRLYICLAVLALVLSFGTATMAASDDAWIIHFPYDEWEAPTDGDPSAAPIIMTFGEGGNGKLLDENNPYFGIAAVAGGVVRISYSEETNLFVNYMAKLKFTEVEGNNKARFVRVLYCAQNPSGVENASIMMEDDSVGKRVLIQEKVANTEGHYVLSDIAVLSPAITSRFMDGAHNSIYFTTSKPGGEYIIKAVYFFETREAAENFDYNLDPDETADISIPEPETQPPTTNAPTNTDAVTDPDTTTAPVTNAPQQTNPGTSAGDTDDTESKPIWPVIVVAVVLVGVVVAVFCLKKAKKK